MSKAYPHCSWIVVEGDLFSYVGSFGAYLAVSDARLDKTYPGKLLIDCVRYSKDRGLIPILVRLDRRASVCIEREKLQQEDLILT